MKEKIKVAFGDSTQANISKVIIAGNEIEVVNRISSAERDELGAEYAAHAVVIDEEKEMAYSTADDTVLLNYLMFKYYTNLDVEDYAHDMGMFFDIVYDYRNEVQNICKEDWYISNEVCFGCSCMLKTVYSQEHSIGHKLMLALKGVLTGEDLMKRLSESKIINEEMIDLIANAKAGEEAKSAENGPVMFPGFAKKAD